MKKEFQEQSKEKIDGQLSGAEPVYQPFCRKIWKNLLKKISKLL